MNTDWRVLLVLLFIGAAIWLYNVCQDEKKVHDSEDDHGEK